MTHEEGDENHLALGGGDSTAGGDGYVVLLRREGKPERGMVGAQEVPCPSEHGPGGAELSVEQRDGGAVGGPSSYDDVVGSVSARGRGWRSRTRWRRRRARDSVYDPPRRFRIQPLYVASTDSLDAALGSRAKRLGRVACDATRATRRVAHAVDDMIARVAVWRQVCQLCQHAGRFGGDD